MSVFPHGRSAGWIFIDPSVPELVDTVLSPEDRLMEIRRLSNTIQAMENLLIQCGDAPLFETLVARCRQDLAAARGAMRRLIHG